MKQIIIDLSHPFKADMPLWPGDPVFLVEQFSTLPLNGYFMNKVSCGEHSGTHIGAPCHFNPRGVDVAGIPAQDLVLPAVKIDISQYCQNNPDYLLTVQDMLAWEQQHLKIPSHCVALVQTGWDRFWNNPHRYFGLAENTMHFPGISMEAAQFLAAQRQVAGVGIDTAGIDGGLSQDFAANKALGDANIYHLENLTNLAQLPETGAILFIGALPIAGGSGSPCRVVGLW
ncbi:MAG TPA: cyclase family protein [bacterium]|nr:cyclase family protein [bacterium]HPN44574.1 cyclase family protein [bacterium]